MELVLLTVGCVTVAYTLEANPTESLRVPC
jgi:hypothetical protein